VRASKAKSEGRSVRVLVENMVVPVKLLDEARKGEGRRMLIDFDGGEEAQ